MRTIPEQRTKSQAGETTAPEQRQLPLDDGTVPLAMIQALIPLGLRAVEEALQREVTALAGYAHADGVPGVVRWGTQPGSVFLVDQKLPIRVPRVRDRPRGQERPLSTYQAFQTPRALDVGLFRRVLGGLSCREYAAAAEAVPEAFGLARSSVSRRFIRASARALRRLQERPLDDAEWLVLVLDGKTFAADQLVIALGVTTTGEKRLLGLVQTATENKGSARASCGSSASAGSGPRASCSWCSTVPRGSAPPCATCSASAQVQRCQWHKRENVVRYLPKAEQPAWRRKLQAAYARPSYASAKAGLLRVHAELGRVNASAAASLLEGLEETLTLHRLGVFPQVGISFKTTNLLESVMARVEARTARVDHWRTSDQKQRWCATALLAVEAQFRRVKGYQHLPLLAHALTTTIKQSTRDAA